MIKTVSVILLAGILTACAGPLRLSDGEGSAAPWESLQASAGHWQGGIAETGGWYRQGLTPLDLTIGPDGTWRGKVGQAAASGTARVQGRQLIISGTGRSATGDEDAVYLRLTGDDAARWGATTADFPGGTTHAIVALQRTG
jgi:hypothetical protein